MYFDLFYEFSVPAHLGLGEQATLERLLDELTLAEHCGFRTAWLAEHHFMPEYSHSSAPDLILAAASQRTRHLRLGHAIVPLPYHHPVHVAERAAMLDLLSGGRLEFGFGRGFSPREYAAFGIPMAASRTRVLESVEILRQAFSGAPIAFSGTHFELQQLPCLPRVLQRPHPPLWMAAVSPDSFELAAELGVGVLVGPFKPWFMARADIRRYRDAWRQHHGTEDGARVGMTIGIVCLEDHARARAAAKAALPWFYGALFQQTAPVLRTLYESYEYYRRLGRLDFLLGKPPGLRVLEQLGMAVAGDPAHCVRALRRYQEAGVDHLLCAVGAGACTPDVVHQSLESLGRHVLPAFTAAAHPAASHYCRTLP